MSLQDILMKAIETEEMGYRFYSEQSNAAKNPLAKTLLGELAADEKRHAAWFRQVVEQMKNGGGPVNWPSGAAPEMEARMKQYFGSMEESVWAGSTDTQEDVLKMAIALERESYGVYHGLFEKAASDMEKEFFDRLRREEYDHLASLENVLTYLTKTGIWFDVEETKRWNWMV